METSDHGRQTVEQIAEEFVERYRNGDRPLVSEYVERHPQYATEIQELFPALLLMERIAPDSDSGAGDSIEPVGTGIPDIQQLGDYRIVREIGRGGMGVVYEAEQVSLGRHVALKVVQQAGERGPRQRHRFEREARATAKLHHTNIVPVFGCGEDQGRQYYVMQLIQGLGLDEVLRELQRIKTRPGDSDGAPARVPPASGESEPAHGDLSAASLARTLMDGGPGRPAAHEGENAEPLSVLEELMVGEETEERLTSVSSGARPARRAATDTGHDSDTFRVCDSSLGLASAQDGSSSTQTRKQTYWQSVAEIGAQVAGALEYAHDQGVLHRDIKPSNLMIDLRGTVWITDFGLAKLADDRDLTQTGDVLGTLRYMAPEAFRGEPDERSEIYSLGLTLYELLAFRPAFERSSRAALVDQILQADVEPLGKQNSEIPLDLRTIVHKAIQRDPAARYQSAGDLARDLQHFLAGEPIAARRVGIPERLARWVRRHPAVASLVGVIAVMLVTVAVGSLFAAQRFKKTADEKGVLAQANAGLASQKEVERNRAVAAQVRAEQQAARALQSEEETAVALYTSNIARSQLKYQAGQIPASQAILERCPPHRRGWEWGYLNGLHHADLFTLMGHTSWVFKLAFSPNGELLASSGGGDPYWRNQGHIPQPGEVIIWDAKTGAPLRTLRGHGHVIHGIAFVSVASATSRAGW